MREGETVAAEPSSREQQQQYAFNKNKYSSRWLEYTIWLCVYRGMKPAIITIIIIVSIIKFQTKSWHQVLKAILQAAKNAIQKLEMVVDSSSSSSFSSSCCQGASVPSSSMDAPLQFSLHPHPHHRSFISLPSLTRALSRGGVVRLGSDGPAY